MKTNSDSWIVNRCPLSNKAGVIRELKEQGFQIHDTFFSPKAQEHEEFTIIAKRREPNV